MLESEKVMNILKYHHYYGPTIIQIVKEWHKKEPVPIYDIPRYIESTLNENEGIKVKLIMDESVDELGVYWYHPARREGEIFLDKSLPEYIMTPIAIHEAIEMAGLNRCRIGDGVRFIEGGFMERPEEAVIESGVVELLYPSLLYETNPIVYALRNLPLSATHGKNLSQAIQHTQNLCENLNRPFFYFALRMLSYELDRTIEWLRTAANARFRGATGRSYIDVFNRDLDISRIEVKVRLSHEGTIQKGVLENSVVLSNTNRKTNHYPEEIEGQIALDCRSLRYARGFLAYILWFSIFSLFSKLTHRLAILKQGEMECKVIIHNQIAGGVERLDTKYIRDLGCHLTEILNVFKNDNDRVFNPAARARKAQKLDEIYRTDRYGERVNKYSMESQP